MGLVVLLPIFASIFLAIWIHLSSVCKKLGIDNIRLSFYYDFITSFIILLGWMFFDVSLITSNTITWILESNLVWQIVLYSIVIGWLPNLFFYSSVSQVGPATATMGLLGEPIVATLLAVVFWNEEVGVTFFLGALLILAANYMHNKQSEQITND